jgi:DNA-binding NarL/FixJ family response regulator
MNPTLSPPLSPRLLEVAELVARGYTNKGIASVLLISERTVEAHVARLVQRVPGDGVGRYRIVTWWFGRTA